jgi:1-acyl-sn-glycerol-3-phosphate acyltransferase
MHVWSYRIIRCLGSPWLWIATNPLVLHSDRADRGDGYILAANHLSPFDVPLMIWKTPRHVDFVSIIELRKHALARVIFELMNTLYLNRNHRDPRTVRQAVRRLKKGRVIALFPEGALRREETSVINGGSFKPGIATIAQLANVPVIPCVVLDSAKLWRFKAWLPGRRTRLGLIFGQPIRVPANHDKKVARTLFVQELRKAYLDLARELRDEMIQR